jgi:2-amino-4-hydroxy-6-hydroxymethyldihydropteridine diphosphokinase
MPIIYLGLGSNLQPEKNLRLGVRELAARFNVLRVSAVYRNKAVGFDGEDFLNAVVVAETDLTADEVCRACDDIHELAGRRRGTDAFVSRTLDIDLLLYGDEIIESRKVPRSDVLEYAFVLRPLAEIAPDLLHPVSGRPMAQHWADFDQGSHPLTEEFVILLNGDA